MKKAIILLAASFLAFGCSTTNSVERAEPTAQKQVVNDKRIISDGALSGYASVVAVNESRVSGGLLKVQVELFNRTPSRRTFNYKFEWMAPDGMQVEGATSTWTLLVLEGRESRFVSAVAPNASVNDFRLKLLPNARD